MGVPKFFRWCAERYPSVITSFKDTPPLVDNLYLDMNGIIHNCSHPKDTIDATQKAPTEKEMIQAMFAFLEKLFNAIQPRHHFFLAVDGVAPRAKMNQQRQRRYRAGYESMVAREEAISMGLEVPDEVDVFDSNCITPGTPFMVRVSKAFEYFISLKISTDLAWQKCNVIYSGHNTPGEGEHKIIEFIRSRKMQPGYNPNETHCMYGLDADLVMLSLATHEPHFVLLRDVVTFYSGSRKEREKQEEDAAKGIVQDKSYHKADEFVLFHINVLRDYLQIDIRERLEQMGAPCTFDIECVIDDFIFMCFFIGNDFIPTIPTLGINDGSILTMLQLYAEHILSKGMLFTDKGVINWSATEIWLSKIGELEFHTILKRQTEEAEFQRNRAKHDFNYEAPSTLNTPITSIEEYKEKFYREKHQFERGWDPYGSDITNLKKSYVEGLSWVIAYYYKGVPSWKWFYAHYYAPMASDLVGLSAVASTVSFQLSEPFLPHQQLLAVLPPMSYRSIPKAYWPLMKSNSSPLASFFPKHIVIDREGARAEWEGTVLIPFISEKVLLAAYASVQSKVDPEDAENNKLGPALCFSYHSQMTPYNLPNDMFGPLRNITVKREVYEITQTQPFNPSLCKGVWVGDRQLEGFSTLQSKRMLLTPTYEIGAVSIFGMATKKESMLLVLESFNKATTVEEVTTLLGKEVLVGFPHYKRARVASLSSMRTTLTAVYNKDGSFSGTEHKEKNRDESAAFLKEAEVHAKYMKSKLGIVVSDIPILVYVHRIFGMRLSPKGRFVRQFNTTETCYPLALICLLSDIKMLEDTRYVERERNELDMAQGTRCIYIGPEPKNRKAEGASMYGSCGQVLSVDPTGDSFTVLLKFFPQRLTLPASCSKFASPDNWMAFNQAADTLGISARTLSAICSSLVTTQQFGSWELGLCLKFTGRCLARVGYSKMVPHKLNPWHMGNVDIFARMEKDTENVGYHLDNTDKGSYAGKSSQAPNSIGTWYLSMAAMQLVRDYIHRFAPLVEYIEESRLLGSCVDPPLFMTGKWSDCDVGDIMQEISGFLEDSGILKVPMITATEDTFPQALLTELESTLPKNEERPSKTITLRQVSKSHLYFPLTRCDGGYLVPIPLPREQTFHLGARVANCCCTGPVEIGAQGTIIRLLASGREAEVVYDIPFIVGKCFEGRLRDCRGAIVKLASLLVLKSGEEESNRAKHLVSPRKDVVQILRRDAAHNSAVEETKRESSTTSRFVPKPRSVTNDSVSTLKIASGNPSDAPSPQAATTILHATNDTLSGSGSGSAAVSFTSSSPKGGINLSELASRLPGVSSPSSVGNTATGGSAGLFPIPAPKSHQLNAHPELEVDKQPLSPLKPSALKKPNQCTKEVVPVPVTAIHKTAQRRSIPDEIMSGKLRISCNESGATFKKWLNFFLTEEIKNLQNGGVGK